ncbi:amidase [Dyadobacter psychrotolerans]|uniref:Amidase n=1 Tax=Dyadobacter psychrotolerans TaxID=2541721 RepID=A0A4R5DUZ0_9BACT|nr:amidase [Dyadobacter psychrotolerans]TDE18356.1 amidase [Dyadobacter psychrotolerans]
MKRRNFIKLSSVAGISATFFPFINCANPDKSTLAGDFELSEITIGGLQNKMKSGDLTARSITQMYLDQIAITDKAGPKINAIIELNPDALAIADSLDEERKSGKVRGPLHGIPVLIKDNIDTADKMQTTAGSLALEGNIASTDAFIVLQLRKAGAVVLGKTNLSEWANFRSSRSSSGWSSRGGQTKNPYILDRSPCGSSSGSGAAVAANLCVVAVGTETNGSIACPASMNGIVGIKPTVGLVSRTGIIPISKTQDTAGPLARSVTDAAILLTVMAGADSNDPVTSESKGREQTNYAQFLDKNGLRGKRIGVEKTFLKKHEGMDNLLQKALEQMKKLGAEIIEIEFIEMNDTDGAESDVLQYEFKDGVNKYLAHANSKVKSLEEVIAFNKQNEAKVMPDFKQETLEESQAKGDLTDEEYLAALAKITNVRKLIDNELKKNNLDALCGPATGPSWCIDPVNGDSWTGYGAYGPAALAGYPSVTLPMGKIKELPVGISFFGKAYDEPGLISIAFAYEQASKNRTVPTFKPSISG